MNQEITAKLKGQKLIDHEMIKAAFVFWFSDGDHLRSPFPLYIRERLQFEAINKFLDWGSRISDKAKKEINDEILVEKFEEIIFELASDMVETEDEKLTIRYPFMPRIGDAIHNKENMAEQSESKITQRSYYKKDDTAFMKVKLIKTVSQEEWETKFELHE